MTQEPIPAAQLASVGTHSARILVVDDEQHTAHFCARALSMQGYQVQIATDVTQALATLHAEQPLDLLLADIQMPGMNGLELARLAREKDPAMAIIIMTGHATVDTLQQTARRGVADFLAKPFELDVLQIAVDQALHKRQLLQESIRLQAVERLLLSSEALNAILERDQLGQVIVTQALSHVACDAAILFVDTPDTSQRQIFAQPAEAMLLPAGEALARQALGTNEMQQIDGTPICQLGEQIIDAGLLVPLRAQGHVVGILLICGEKPKLFTPSMQDMLVLLANQAGTALRNAQLYSELQRAYSSLRELDKLKSEFIAIASHELRSPLSIVLGYTKMVRDRSEGSQREYAQRALDSADQIKMIVDTMILLREYESNQATVNLADHALSELVQQALERSQVPIEQKQQTVALKLAEPDLTLQADREKFLLVLSNLLDNASKFSPAQAIIRLDVEYWEHAKLLAAASAAVPNPTLYRLAQRTPSTWAVIQVTDTGIGIVREQQAKIFERFYQVAVSLTRSQGGVGLGLALVADLVILQHGLVWVESEEGKGSTFRFALPITTADL